VCTKECLDILVADILVAASRMLALAATVIPLVACDFALQVLVVDFASVRHWQRVA